MELKAGDFLEKKTQQLDLSSNTGHGTSKGNERLSWHLQMVVECSDDGMSALLLRVLLVGSGLFDAGLGQHPFNVQDLD